MALPSHIVAWLSLEARQLRPAQPNQARGFFPGKTYGSVTHRSPEISITSVVVMHMETSIWQQFDLSFQAATFEDTRFRH